MSKFQILPPVRSNLPVARPANSAPVSPPGFHPGGIVGSALARLEARRHWLTTQMVTERTQAEAALFEAQALVIDSYGKRQRAGYHLRELPEILAADRARRRIERAEEYRQLQHEHDVAETRRRAELANAESAMVDAQQALQAQRDYGHITYQLAWKRKSCETLDVELSAAERRAILRQHLGELEAPQNAEDQSAKSAEDNALYESRAQLNADGLDPSTVDAAIESRKRRR